MIELTIIFGLILCNAIFVASEFATVATPRISMEKQAQAGHKGAEMILSILKQPLLLDRYIAASQVGITAASLGLGMYGEQVIANRLVAFLQAASFLEVASIHVIASALSVVALTYLHIVLGEMIPKSLALQRSEAMMLLLVRPMFLFMKACWPIIFLLNGLNNFLLKNFLGIDRTRATMPAFSSEEIQLIVKDSETEGIISDDIGIVIEQMFDFGDLVAEDIMVPRVHMVALPMRPRAAELRQSLVDTSHSRYPVYNLDKDNIVGAVHIKDLAALLESEGERPLPIRPVPFVSLSAPLQAVLKAMRELSTHLAVVLDEHGGTAGIITIQDIFEEVIGEIDDSLSQPAIELLEDGAIKVEGTVRLDELSEHFEIPIEQEGVTTISGLVLDQLNRPPKVGDEFHYGPISIEVVKVKGRGAQSCIVRRIPNNDKDHGNRTES